MNCPSGQEPELIASGLGWPEGPMTRLDGSIVLVESYRSQLTLVGQDGQPRRFAYAARGSTQEGSIVAGERA